MIDADCYQNGVSSAFHGIFAMEGARFCMISSILQGGWELRLHTPGKYGILRL